jgi:hypothetical protein
VRGVRGGNVQRRQRDVAVREGIEKTNREECVNEITTSAVESRVIRRKENQAWEEKASKHSVRKLGETVTNKIEHRRENRHCKLDDRRLSSEEKLCGKKGNIQNKCFNVVRRRIAEPLKLRCGRIGFILLFELKRISELFEGEPL